MTSLQAVHKPSLGLWNSAQATAPVTGLPADVLLHIFLILRDADIHRGHFFTYSVYNQWNWVTVSMVCRRWRKLALEYPSLWSNIHVSDIGSATLSRAMKMIRVFLERSGQVKLDIIMDLDYDCGEVPALFEGHMHRVQSLKLMSGHEGMEGMIPRLVELSQNAKILELSYESDLDSRGRDTCSLDNLPDTISNVQLDELSLDCFTLPWSCSLYHGLTKLTITRVRTWSFSELEEPTIWQFIDTLEHCPNLQHLHLHDFSPVVGDARVHEIEKRRLQFPLLKSITLEKLPPQDCAKVFAMFTIGANVDLDVSIGEEHEDEEAYPIPQIVQCLPRVVLVERKACKSIKISLDFQCSTVSSEHPDYARRSDTCVVPPVTTVSALVGSFGTYTISITAIRAFLEDQFWQNACNITINFKSNFISTAPRMDRILWCSFLDGLPRFVRRLTVKFAYREFEFCDVGFDEALSGLDSVGRVRLQELEELTICYESTPPEYVVRRRDIFSHHIKERNKQTMKKCELTVMNVAL